MKKNLFLFLFFLLTYANNHAITLDDSKRQQDSLNYYYELALKPNSPNDFTLAYDYFLKHKTESLANNNIEGAVYDLRLLAIIQNESGFLYDAEKSSVEALQLLEVIEDNTFKTNSKIGLYNQLGRIKKALKDYKAALKYYDLALELSTNDAERSSILNNKAFIHVENEELDKALQVFKDAHQIAIASDNIKKKATTLDNLGFIKSKLNKDDGLEEMIQALEYRIDNNLIKGQFASYNHLAQYYASKGDNDKANLYLKSATDIAEKINSKAYKLESLKQLIAVGSDSIAQSYLNLKEQVDDRNLLIENKYAARKYNYELQESIALKNKKDKQLFQVILLALLIIGVLGFFLIKSRHTKSKLREVYKTEFKLSKRIHDEVSNDIYQVMVQLDSKNKDSDVVDALDKIYSKTRDISRENRVISKNDDFEEAILDLIRSFKTKDTNIITKGISTIRWNRFDTLKQITLFRVIQELLTNMRKHSKANLVAFIFEENAKNLVIKYSDNGIGTQLKSKNGLSNTENRMASIGGKITFESEPNQGFKARLSIK